MAAGGRQMSGGLNRRALGATACAFVAAIAISIFSCVHGFPCAANQFLANSAWPIAQNNNCASASTDLPAPYGSADAYEADVLLNPSLADSISLLYASDNCTVWGSSFTYVFKVDRCLPRLKLIAAFPKPKSVAQNDTFHGAYSALSSEGLYYTVLYNTVQVYADDDPSQPRRSGIKLHASWTLDENLREEEESIIGLSMSYDGCIIFGTTFGKVGVLARDLTQSANPLLALMDISQWGIVPPGHRLEVSNSLSLDASGGIYVVSSFFVHKLRWNFEKRTLDIVWTAPYDTTLEPPPGRLSKLGSGSTPSLMVTDVGTYVVITDGAPLMNIVIYDADNGARVAQKPVTFGNSTARFSFSDQSVLVSGKKMVVVNNQMTRAAQVAGTPLFLGTKGFSAIDELVEEGKAPAFMSEISTLWPVLMGDAPRGIEQFTFDPISSTIYTSWARTDITIPNGIPSMSVATGLMYGIGKRKRREKSANILTGMWTLEAIDWMTGASVFHVDIGSGPEFNSLFAATEIGPDGECITGVLGGVVRIQRKLTAVGTPERTNRRGGERVIVSGEVIDRLPGADGPRRVGGSASTGSGLESSADDWSLREFKNIFMEYVNNFDEEQPAYDITAQSVDIGSPPVTPAPKRSFTRGRRD